MYTKANFQVWVGQNKCVNMCMKCCTMLVGAQYIYIYFWYKKRACGRMCLFVTFIFLAQIEMCLVVTIVYIY